MATTNKTLVEGVQLPSAVAAQYTAPANTTTLLKKVTVANPSASAIAVTIYLVPSGGTAGSANCVTSAKAIAAGQTYEVYEAENHVLMPGDSLQAFAGTAAAVSLRASGIEIV